MIQVNEMMCKQCIHPYLKRHIPDSLLLDESNSTLPLYGVLKSQGTMDTSIYR